MIYKPEVDTVKYPNNKEIIAECDCKCKALHFTKWVDEIEPISTDYIISLYGNLFMADQDRGWYKFKTKLKNLWMVIRGKEFHLNEIVITESDMKILAKELSEWVK